MYRAISRVEDTGPSSYTLFCCRKSPEQLVQSSKLCVPWNSCPSQHFTLHTETTSATKRRAEGAAPADQGTGPSQVMVVEQPLSPFQKGWARLREQYGGNPIFKRVEEMSSGLNDNAALRKSREMREDLKERWETSDSPLVHRIQVRSEFLFAWNHTHLSVDSTL